MIHQDRLLVFWNAASRVIINRRQWGCKGCKDANAQAKANDRSQRHARYNPLD
jgi:hypothetical protein